ncbi:hypothetical protein INP57_23235 [Saccharopolyspora sp. HNM0986]|uniref:hypothetical protein n=1 Tax=Saccharopolyspora galaxeae TaxID=2781241 RepID=UPI001F2E019A|nr:hypothetical protein [Saccharopolyspora sp. HNM0986]MBK0869733.1 hypothetical protein [Saccharopolyspora sp. HNM0986]
MTIQDDLVRPWFQPAVPPEQQPGRPRPDAGPVTTRFAGELPLDAAPRPDTGLGRAGPPAPADRVEVTQPYIPAIREERPEFAKRLNPDPSPAPAPGGAPPAPHRPEAPATGGTVADLAPVSPPQQPVRPEQPAMPTPAPQQGPSTQRDPSTQRAPAKRRSLARRVVRRIIGPDLLRKDPPKKKG